MSCMAKNPSYSNWDFLALCFQVKQMTNISEDDTSSDSYIIPGLSKALSKPQAAARMVHAADYSSDSSSSTSHSSHSKSNKIVRNAPLLTSISTLVKTQEKLKQNDRSTKTPSRPSSQRDLIAAGPSSRVSSDAASVSLRSPAFAKDTSKTTPTSEPAQGLWSALVASSTKRKLDNFNSPTSYSPGAPDIKRLKLKPEPHENFWLPEGNAIIEVGAVQYKLHKSRLKHFSTFFSSLFDMKTEGDGGKLDGLPVYHLTNKVAPADFDNLLTALDDAM